MSIAVLICVYCVLQTVLLFIAMSLFSRDDTLSNCSMSSKDTYYDAASNFGHSNDDDSRSEVQSRFGGDDSADVNLSKLTVASSDTTNTSIYVSCDDSKADDNADYETEKRFQQLMKLLNTSKFYSQVLADKWNSEKQKWKQLETKTGAKRSGENDSKTLCEC